MSDLTAVSLFAGIGGIDRALDLAGVSVRAAVEIDPACRGVLARHFPGTVLFDDVTEVTGDQLRAAGFVPGRGILAGGFPCQGLSVAGRRKGLADARSGLFWHVMRLADELRPRWILLENVPGLLSSVCPCPGDGTCTGNGRVVECGEWRLVSDEPDERIARWFPDVPHAVKGGACATGCMAAHGGAMGTVLGALGERGYGFAYRVLDAQFFGVPQQRRRVFIVGCLGDVACPVQVLLEPESGEGNPAEGCAARPDAAAPTRGGAISALQGGGRRGHRVDAEGAAGGHLVAVATFGGQGIAHALTAEGADASEDGTGRGTPIIAYALTSRNDRNDREENYVTEPMAFNPQTGGSRARLGYGAKPSALQASQVTAVHMAVGIAENQRGEVVESAISHQLTTGGGKPGQGYPAVQPDSRVRRLLPVECERLQGFPDGWTENQADAARYRELGNSVAVPCVEWITHRIVAADASLVAANLGAA